jgi:hypothetical protein
MIISSLFTIACDELRGELVMDDAVLSSFTIAYPHSLSTCFVEIEGIPGGHRLSIEATPY